MTNPYQSPQFPTPPTSSPYASVVDREKLRRTARYQQWVLYAILAMIILYLAFFAPGEGPSVAKILISLLYLGVWVFSMAAVFLLAKEVYNTAIGVLCAILMIVPCISLITLLVVNGKATSFLQQNGIKVGFMGTNPNSI